MTELVQQDDHQIVLRAVIVIEPEIEIEVAAELRDDLGKTYWQSE
jgi:hypothetical protein